MITPEMISEAAHQAARCVRGCATDDEYMELVGRIQAALTHQHNITLRESSSLIRKLEIPE